MSGAKTSYRRLGIMAGTFNPPHLGHLMLAQTALNQLELNHVLFLPVGSPTHKETSQHVDIRIKLTELAIADNPYFSLDLTDVERQAPHYTATLMPLIASRYPSSDLWLLIGSDSLLTFPAWYQPRNILKACRLAVLPRPAYPIDWPSLEASLTDLHSCVDMLDGPAIFISSTYIRNALVSAVSLENSLRYLLKPEVIEAISRYGLYS
ncbi:MAG: nicotinate (nicotinamide) nucleotide adenylyltransferase [Chloroflexota bacterium]